MLNYNQALKETKTYSGLEMSETKPVMKLILRGKTREFLSAVGKSLNLLLPTEPNTSTTSQDLTALWLSPDEWMIYSNDLNSTDSNTYEIEEKLTQNISKSNFGAVVDVTDQFVMINLKGPKIYDLLQTGSPFDYKQFKKKKGSVTQTILAKIDVIVNNKNNENVNLFVRRSFSEHLFSWMNDSASRL
jgi:sarcosine oxidase, subunit gamma